MNTRECRVRFVKMNDLDVVFVFEMNMSYFSIGLSKLPEQQITNKTATKSNKEFIGMHDFDPEMESETRKREKRTLKWL